MRRGIIGIALIVGLAVAGCGSGSTATGGGAVRVVAAENFWGSIAAQLGGGYAQVTSIIVNPAEDPHSYQPRAGDARTLATARLAIVNGVGYDPWASQLLGANPASGRVVINVGNLLGLHEGDNPHRWYDPADVEAVANAITADLRRLDPTHSSYFTARRAQFEHVALAGYHGVVASIRRRYGATAVGASESIFALLSPALGLRLITPPTFMKSLSEGTEVSAQDMLTVERQLSSRQVKVWIYNSQNATPAIQRLNGIARAAGIPIVTVTETLAPASATFQQWQVSQLQRLARALHEATNR
jgi:zinc/manganese transport system substrate-binding protein